MSEPTPARRPDPATQEEIDRAAKRGASWVRWGWWATGGFLVVAAASIAVAQLKYVAIAVDLVLLLAGLGLFGAGFLRAAQRSRDEVITVAGSFFLLDGVGPKVRRALWLQFVIQVAGALAVAPLRRHGAFAILAPMLGIGLMAWWGAAFGVFPARPPARAAGRGPAGARQSDAAGARQSDAAGARQSDAAGARQSDTAGARQSDTAGARQSDTAGARQSDTAGARPPK